MKISLFLAVICCLALQTVFAQTQSDKYQYFDKKWHPASKKKAVYLLRVRHDGDSSWQFKYYRKFGPMIRMETYQDEKATVRHGRFAWYNEKGMLDSSGYFYQGQRNGNWYYANDSITSHYENGRLLTKKEFRASLDSMSIVDPSLPDPLRPTPESYFPGGKQGWFHYLSTHFRYPDEAVDNAISGTVVLMFAVQPTGKIADVGIRESIEIALDDEALSLIHESPDWIPAVRFDRKVWSYKIQPVVFKVEFGN
jgi:protein TonB